MLISTFVKLTVPFTQSSFHQTVDLFDVVIWESARSTQGNFVRNADLCALRSKLPLSAHSGQYCALHECLSGARCCQLIVLLDDRLERLYGRERPVYPL